MEVYSPDLVAAQQEYLVATRGLAKLKDAGPEYQASMQSLIEASLQRLRNLDIGEAELAHLRDSGQPVNSMTIRSPVSATMKTSRPLSSARCRAACQRSRLSTRDRPLD